MLTLNKFRAVTIDIETRHAPSWRVKQAQAKILRDDPHRGLKDPVKVKANLDKIEADYLKKLVRIKKDSALLNSAPIACIGIVADGLLLHFSTFSFSDREKVRLEKEGILFQTFADEKGMMEGFASFLDSFCDYESLLIGFNSCKFDFPKLRLACSRNKVKRPILLKAVNKSLTVDLMKKFTDLYNCENTHEKYISLPAVCGELGIPYQKGVEGKDIPDAIEAGKGFDVTMACMHDAIETHQIFLKL